MSQHRYPCTAQPPELTGFPPEAGHIHACIHDADDGTRLAEHRCECGTTWTYRPIQMPRAASEVNAAGLTPQEGNQR